MKRSRQLAFHGILAIGNSKNEAISRYKKLVSGSSASVFTDEAQTMAFISNASSASGEMFNPQTGNLDVVVNSSLLKEIEFNSQSSGNVNVDHVECSNCGAHSISDVTSFVKFCPVCASSIEEDTLEVESNDEEWDTETDALLNELTADSCDEESGDSEEDDLDLEAEASDDSEEELDTLDDEDDSLGDDLPEDDSLDTLDEEDDSLGDELEEVPEDTVVASSSLEEAVQLFVKNTSVSNSSGKVRINYMVCTNKECTAHVVSTSAVDECPACKSTLEEPSTSQQSLASSLSFEMPEPLIVVASSLDEATDLFIKGRGNDLPVAGEHINYVLCSNSKCGAHILSDGQVDVCPSCLASVEEPTEVPDSVFGDIKDWEIDSESDDIDTSVIDEEPEEEEDSSEEPEEEEESTDEASTEEDSSEEPVDEAPSEEEEEAPSEEDELQPNLDTAVNPINSDTVDVNPLDQVAASDYEKLDVVYCSALNGKPRWIVYHEGQPIASASREELGKNQDLFDNPKFSQAVLSSAKHLGIQQALTELGFQPILTKISISKAVRTMVDKEISESRSQLDSDQKLYRDKLEAALATAAVGINRGFFADITNPLKDKLTSALSSAGVKNADLLIAQAFKDSADAYHKLLFAKANDILAKPDDVQESLAHTVLEMNYQMPVSTSSTLEDKVSNFGNVVHKHEELSESKVTNLDTSFNVKANSIVAGLGRR